MSTAVHRATRIPKTFFFFFPPTPERNMQTQFDSDLLTLCFEALCSVFFVWVHPSVGNIKKWLKQGLLVCWTDYHLYSVISLCNVNF